MYAYSPIPYIKEVTRKVWIVIPIMLLPSVIFKNLLVYLIVSIFLKYRETVRSSNQWFT